MTGLPELEHYFSISFLTSSSTELIVMIKMKIQLAIQKIQSFFNW